MGDFDHIVAAIQASPITTAFASMVETNDFSRLEGAEAKRHHFVSQFLLRGFAQKQDDKAFLFQMEAGSRRAPMRVDVRTAASRHRYYSVPDENGELSNRNEGYLALIETHAAPALRHLLDDPASLTMGERATIAFFIALQTMRTPAAEQQTTTVANAAFQNWASEFYSDRAAYAKRHREQFGAAATDQEVEAFRRESLAQIRDGRLKLSGRSVAIATGLAHAVNNVPSLIEFHWTLLRGPQGGFVTSDRGYSIHDPAPRFPWSFQALLSSELTETAVPISDRACLVMRPTPMGCQLDARDATRQEVETINLRTLGWADRYVFGRTQQTLVDVRLASRQRPEQVIRPRPFVQVVALEPDPDDRSLVEANLRRGWPGQLINDEGQLRDYVVIECDRPQPKLREMIERLAEQRAFKRAGLAPQEF
jgi:hypothetical protein